MGATACGHEAAATCTTCKASFCGQCTPGGVCKDCAYGALTSAAQAHAGGAGAAAAVPAPARRSPVPLVVGAVALLAGSILYAAPRIVEPVPPPSREVIALGAAALLHEAADLVDALAQGSKLPDGLKALESAGVTYARAGEDGYALSVEAAGAPVRLEVKGAKRVLSGPGTEGLGAQGGGK